MNDRSFYLQRLHAEGPLFLRVLRAVPADRLDYAPHPAAPTAGEILNTLAQEHRICCELVATGVAEWRKVPPGTHADSVSLFEKAWAMLQEKVSYLDDTAWHRDGRFRSGEKEYPGQPVGQFLWYILFDAIHHRGQLTTYIRPMGGRVPSVYGPSGDDTGKKS